MKRNNNTASSGQAHLASSGQAHSASSGQVHSASSGQAVIGWDIGGANIKAVYLGPEGMRVIQLPFPIWEARNDLEEVLAEILRSIGRNGQEVGFACAGVTITAELSDAFRSKREGIHFVLDSLQAVLPENISLHVFGSDGRFHDPQTARDYPLLVAAANWMATATLVARHYENCVLVDIGSTTTDVIPIAGGQVVARGRDDPSRLIHGELLYTGAQRTNICAIVQRVPLWGYWCPVSAEYFATIQDVYLLLGEVAPEACSSPTADGRPATAPFAAERLARVVCADAEMLSADEIESMARYIAVQHSSQIAGAIAQVRARNDISGPLIASGAGAFLVWSAAEQLGVPCQSLHEVLSRHAAAEEEAAPGSEVAPGSEASIAAPAYAVAILLSEDASCGSETV